MCRSTGKIPLVLAFTPNYFIPAAVCILSVLKHAEPADYFHIICLLSEPLPDRMQQQLRRLGGNRAHCSFIDLRGKLQGIYVDEKYTIAASYRLLLPDLFPGYAKVLYVDCDMVVRNNLARLYRETELGNNYLAGVFEATLDFQVAHIKAVGCEPGKYVNSGFLLMNLKQLREDNMVDKFLAASKSAELEFPDQDVLNKLCRGRILGLPPYYNGIRTFYLPRYKSDFLKYYTEEEWDRINAQGTVHYTGTKPWAAFTVQFDVWWAYYAQLPREIRKEEQVNGKVKCLAKVYRTPLGGGLVDGLQAIYRKLKIGSEI